MQGADPGRAGADDEHGIAAVDFRDLCRPETCRQNIARKERLFVGNAARDLCQAAVRIGDAHEFGLSAVDAAAERPTSVFVRAVVYESVAAEIAAAAESFDVHGDAVAFFQIGDGGARFFHDTHHFVADGNAGYGAGHASVFDVQIACADRRECDADDCVARRLNDGLRLFDQAEFSRFQIGIGEHCFLLLVLAVDHFRRRFVVSAGIAAIECGHGIKPAVKNQLRKIHVFLFFSACNDIVDSYVIDIAVERFADIFVEQPRKIVFVVPENGRYGIECDGFGKMFVDVIEHVDDHGKVRGGDDGESLIAHEKFPHDNIDQAFGN